MDEQISFAKTFFIVAGAGFLSGCHSQPTEKSAAAVESIPSDETQLLAMAQEAIALIPEKDEFETQAEYRARSDRTAQSFLRAKSEWNKSRQIRGLSTWSYDAETEKLDIDLPSFVGQWDKKITGGDALTLVMKYGQPDQEVHLQYFVGSAPCGCFGRTTFDMFSEELIKLVSVEMGPGYGMGSEVPLEEATAISKCEFDESDKLNGWARINTEFVLPRNEARLLPDHLVVEVNYNLNTKEAYERFGSLCLIKEVGRADYRNSSQMSANLISASVYHPVSGKLLNRWTF